MPSKWDIAQAKKVIDYASKGITAAALYYGNYSDKYRNRTGSLLAAKKRAQRILKSASVQRMRRRYGSSTMYLKKRRRRRGSRGLYRSKRRKYAIRRIRPEIHTITDSSTASQQVGLYNVDSTSSGHLMLLTESAGRSFTPRISQGDSVSTRTANKVQMKTFYARFRFTTQLNYIGPMKVKIYIFSRPLDSTTGTAISSFLNADPLIVGTTIYSPMSSRNKEDYAEYRVIREMDVYIPEDGSAGAFPIHIEKEVAIPMKGKVLSWNAGSSNKPYLGDLGCIILANNGATSLGQALSVQWETKLHYIDV